MDAEAFHHTVTARNTAVGEDPHDHVHRLRHQRDEIPERIVGCACLRNFVVWLGFCCVDQVGELDCVLNEKDGDVVPDEVEVALVCIELCGKAADIACGIGRATRA